VVRKHYGGRWTMARDEVASGKGPGKKMGGPEDVVRRSVEHRQVSVNRPEAARPRQRGVCRGRKKGSGRKESRKRILSRAAIALRKLQIDQEKLKPSSR